MNYLGLVFTLILFFGCTKYFEVGFKNGIHYGINIDSEIERAKIVPWKVGQDREVTISQGVRFFTSTPLFSNEAKELLGNKYGIDAWVFRFSKSKRGRSTPIGYFYLKFQNMTRNTKNISVSLFYQAAAVSKRFRFFHCPAFEHRKEIDSIEILDRPGFSKKDLYIRSVEKIRAKVTRFKFSPMIIPGGRSLSGDYFVDMAFYSSASKQRFSEWTPVDKVLRIGNEVDRLIKSCNGIKEELNPLPKSRVPDIRDFEIK